MVAVDLVGGWLEGRSQVVEVDLALVHLGMGEL
jgi:hypothetical protein